MSAPTLNGHTLVPATDAQDLEATKREWTEWGLPLLSKDQFIRREKQVLGPTDFSTTRRRRWVLVPTGDTTTLDFLSACETYRRPILIKRGKDEVKRALSYSVCSVFVPKPKRSRGYAGEMMTLLQHNLNPQRCMPGDYETGSVEGSNALVVPLSGGDGEEHLCDETKHTNNATCSFLYSDVGDYYAKFGWKVVGNRHVEWTPLDAQTQVPESARWLAAEELPEIGAIDRDYLLSQLESSTSSNGAVRFCLDDPTATSWRWLIKRTNYYATTLLAESAAKPSRFALMLPGAKPSYAVWMFDFVQKKIAILRLRFSSLETFSILVNAVRAEAAKFDMTKVVAWNVDLAKLGVQLSAEDQAKLREGDTVDRFHKELVDGSVVERKGSQASLPMLSFYGDRKEGEKVEWVANEYGLWC